MTSAPAPAPALVPNSSYDRLALDLGERSYDILVGPGLLQRVGELLAPVMRQKRVFIVSDQTLALLHLPYLLEALDEAGISHDHIVLPPGEQTKDFPHLEGVLDAMLEARCERGTLIIALGGGVIGDLTGFAASVLLRGVDFVQIPTTLLAQVDSSVGGKTAINARQGKNLIGAFHQPRLVLADTKVLETLDHRQLLAGYAEVFKYGCIDDEPFFAWLEQNGARLIAGDEEIRRQAIVTSCRAKARVVGLDERENGLRALLNLGHTFGHAFEAEAGYGQDLLHGEAVALGIVLAYRLSVRMGLCPAADSERLERHLAAIGLPVRPPEIFGLTWDADRLIGHMASDKKMQDGKVTFVLARGIGKAELRRDVTPKDLRAVIAEFLA